MVEDFLWLIVAKACLIRDAVFTVFNGEGCGSVVEVSLSFIELGEGKE